MSKKDKEIKSYYLSRETAQQVKDKADTHPYMNASNIVEQAIKEWLRRNDKPGTKTEREISDYISKQRNEGNSG